MEKYDVSYHNAMMRVIVQPLVEEELQLFDRYNTIPGEYAEKTRKRIESSIRKYDTRAVYASVWKVVKRGLVCAMVGLMVVFCSCAAIPSLREKIINAVVEWYDEYIVVHFEDTAPVAQPYRELGYIPDGFISIYEDEWEGFLTRIYTSEQGATITFMREPAQSLADFSVSYVDGEHHMLEDVQVGDTPGVFLQGMDGYENMLLWYREGYVYTLIGYFPCEELVKIATNIK